MVKSYRNPKFHYVLLVALLILSLLRALIWCTPTNKHSEYGLDFFIGFDFPIGFGGALIIAILSFIARESAPSKIIYLTTQVFAWGSSVVLLVGIIARAFYVAMNGGV